MSVVCGRRLQHHAIVRPIISHAHPFKPPIPTTTTQHTQKKVPRMTLNDANRLRRFITLVDCLYEHRAQLVLLGTYVITCTCGVCVHMFTCVYFIGGYTPSAPYGDPTDSSHASIQNTTTAEAPPAELFDAKGNRDSQQDEVFAFDRTVSRLMEMQARVCCA